MNRGWKLRTHLNVGASQCPELDDVLGLLHKGERYPVDGEGEGELEVAEKERIRGKERMRGEERMWGKERMRGRKNEGRRGHR